MDVTFLEAIRAEGKVVHEGKHVIRRPNHVQAVQNCIRCNYRETNIAPRQLLCKHLDRSFETTAEVSFRQASSQEITPAGCSTLVSRHQTQSFELASWNFGFAHVAEFAFAQICTTLGRSLLEALSQIRRGFLAHNYLLLQQHAIS